MLPSLNFNWDRYKHEQRRVRLPAAVVSDPAVFKKTGQRLNVIDLEREYGFSGGGTLPSWR